MNSVASHVDQGVLPVEQTGLGREHGKSGLPVLYTGDISGCEKEGEKAREESGRPEAEGCRTQILLKPYCKLNPLACSVQT